MKSYTELQSTTRRVGSFLEKEVHARIWKIGFVLLKSEHPEMKKKRT